MKWNLSAEEHGKLSEDLQACYSKGDNGTFTLDATDPRLSEFRENNIRYKKERDELRALADEKASQSKSSAGQAASLAEEVQKLRENQERMAAKLQAAESKNAYNSLRTKIEAVGKEMKINPSAVEDILLRAEKYGFTWKDDNAVAMNGDDVRMSERNQNAPVTLREWMEGIKENGAGHLFSRPVGGTQTVDTPGVKRVSVEDLYKGGGDGLLELAEGKAAVQYQ